MRKLKVKISASLPASYPIFIDSGLLRYPSTWLPNDVSFEKILIITDNTVKKLYADHLVQRLQTQGYCVVSCAFPAGEKYKNAETKQRLEKEMLRHHCGRDTLCLALGGGVVGDLAGFVAATYMRGIPYVQIPTTLLAMVDSSVGGKTGINTPQGKNLIGAFWQPKAVIADFDCLKTLTQKQMLGGFVEMMKMFLTSDAKSFYFFQKNIQKIINREENLVEQLIDRAVKIKADVVAKDEKEMAQRKLLNFGHTLGHAIENVSTHKVSHGEAVALGILLETKIAQILGILPELDCASIAQVLSCLGISSKKIAQFNIHKIIQATKLDKKVQKGKVHYVLLKTIGQAYEENNCFAHPVSDDVVRKAYASVLQIEGIKL